MPLLSTTLLECEESDVGSGTDVTVLAVTVKEIDEKVAPDTVPDVFTLDVINRVTVLAPLLSLNISQKSVPLLVVLTALLSDIHPATSATLSSRQLIAVDIF